MKPLIRHHRRSFDFSLLVPLVKLLGNGELKSKINIKVNAASKTAREKIEKQGGSVTLL